jgi:hypothetical protein
LAGFSGLPWPRFAGHGEISVASCNLTGACGRYLKFEKSWNFSIFMKIRGGFASILPKNIASSPTTASGLSARFSSKAAQKPSG